MSSHTIPVVNLNDFVQGTEGSKQQFVNDLGKAFEDVGFVAVKGHGIPQELIDAYYDVVKKLLE